MQFGGTLQHLLQHIAYADPHFGPPQLLIFDLSDGYYRIRLMPEEALELAVLLPGPTPKIKFCRYTSVITYGVGGKAPHTFVHSLKPWQTLHFTPFETTDPFNILIHLSIYPNKCQCIFP
jgi:hypothetical protein